MLIYVNSWQYQLCTVAFKNHVQCWWNVCYMYFVCYMYVPGGLGHSVSQRGVWVTFGHPVSILDTVFYMSITWAGTMAITGRMYCKWTIWTPCFEINLFLTSGKHLRSGYTVDKLAENGFKRTTYNMSFCFTSGLWRIHPSSSGHSPCSCTLRNSENSLTPPAFMLLKT